MFYFATTCASALVLAMVYVPGTHKHKSNYYNAKSNYSHNVHKHHKENGKKHKKPSWKNTHDTKYGNQWWHKQASFKKNNHRKISKHINTYNKPVKHAKKTYGHNHYKKPIMHVSKKTYGHEYYPKHQTKKYIPKVKHSAHKKSHNTSNKYYAKALHRQNYEHHHDNDCKRRRDDQREQTKYHQKQDYRTDYDSYEYEHQTRDNHHEYRMTYAY